MSLTISTALLDSIRDHARAAGSEECCGLLLGARESGRVAAIRPAANVAAEPRHFFEIDPVVLLQAHREARSGGPAILGYYHSHPEGTPTPSLVDAAMAQGNGEIWLLIGGTGSARAWRAVPVGQLHGRFEPMALIETDTPSAPR
ncbi:MAG TPA: M67 family metallopeptidase [Sphingobium sp.]|nr:M67 family metallopeptidase [Sphingobium sp.]